jgi:hypothetical protein
MKGSKDSKKSLFEIINDPNDRQVLIDALCAGVPTSSEFVDQLEVIIDNFYVFDIDGFKGSLYEEDDDIIDLILPAFRRAWGKTYVTPPTLLSGDRLELFQLLFSTKRFIEYLLDMLPKIKGMLGVLTELDRSAESVSLLVDNYIAKNVRLSRESKDIKLEIRDLKIQKTLE